ncbi:hypothetical protein quinque_007094 [Culex quinquefasciatus]
MKIEEIYGKNQQNIEKRLVKVLKFPTCRLFCFPIRFRMFTLVIGSPFGKRNTKLKPPSSIAVPMDIGEAHHNKNKGSGGECSPTHHREPDTVCSTSRLIDSGGQASFPVRVQPETLTESIP